MSDPQSVKGWDEDSSRTFLDYGRYFVPLAARCWSSSSAGRW